MDYNNQEWDDIGVVIGSGTSWKWYPNKNGTYRVNASLNMGSIAPTSANILSLNKNGSTSAVLDDRRTLIAFNKNHGASTVKLTTTDYITITAFMDHGSLNSATLNEPITGYLEIEKIGS